MDREMKERTKTMQEIVEQFHRIAMGTGEHESLRHKAFEVYWRYMNAINASKKYWNLREHVVKCINGDISSEGRRCYLYPAIKNLTKEEKQVIAGRVADTIVRFTRKQYAGF